MGNMEIEVERFIGKARTSCAKLGHNRKNFRVSAWVVGILGVGR